MTPAVSGQDVPAASADSKGIDFYGNCPLEASREESLILNKLVAPRESI